MNLFLEVDENSTTGLAAGLNTTAHAGLGDLREDSTVDLANSQNWRDVPNMVESNGGELTTPLSSDTDTIKEGHEFVAKSEPAVKAGV